MKPSFIVLLSALTLIVLGSPSFANTVPVRYQKAVFSVPSENVVAFWALEDLPTYSMGLKSSAHVYRNPMSLPSPSVVRGTAVGYSGGHVQFRQNDLNAVTKNAISVTGGGSLSFPLTAVAGSSFTFHFWVKFDALSAAGVPVEPFLSVIGSDLQLTTEELIGGGSSLAISGFSFGSSWKFVSLSVQITSPSSSVWSVSVFDGSSTVSVSAPRPGWTGSSIVLQGNSFGSTTFDNVALVAGSVSGSHLDQLVAAGNLGACLSDPCFSGVQCTPISSSRFQCGPCPSQYNGDGIDCLQTSSQFPQDYRACVPHGAQLLDPTFCAATCTHRWTCMACTNNYDSTPELATEARGLCDDTYAYERSASPTPSKTATSSVTASSTVTSSSTATSSVTASTTASVTASITPSVTAAVTPSRTPSVTAAVTPSRTPSVTAAVTPSVTAAITPSRTPAGIPVSTSITWNGISDFDISESTFGNIPRATSLRFTSSGNYGHAHGGTVFFYISLKSNGNWVQVASYSTSGDFYFNSGINFSFSALTNVTALRMDSSPYQNQTYHGWSGATFVISG